MVSPKVSHLIHELPLHAAERAGEADALLYRDERLSYDEVAQGIRRCAAALLELGLERSARVAVYMEKRPEAVVAMFGAAAGGGVFVPVNPLLKPDQVAYILRDCNVQILVTTAERLSLLAPLLRGCPDLRTTLVLGEGQPPGASSTVRWDDALGGAAEAAPHRVIDADMAKGTGEDDGDGEATLVTWGEDGQGDGQDWEIAWGTVAAYGEGEAAAAS